MYYNTQRDDPHPGEVLLGQTESQSVCLFISTKIIGTIVLLLCEHTSAEHSQSRICSTPAVNGLQSYNTNTCPDP